MILIEAKGLAVDLGGARVLHDVDFALERGEIVTIVGPNGAGKTTLLRALIGAIRPSEGQVIRPRDLAIGYVPQKLAIDRSMPLTVRRFLGLPTERDAADIEQALEDVGLAGEGGKQLTALSGGQTQRALLARAMLGRPDVLALDEPTQGLDQLGEAAFYRLIDEIRRRLNCAVLMVSHDLHVVSGAADRVICLNGHICCEGAPTVVSAAPEYRALFGLGTGGALALYRHEHDHAHEHGHEDGHDHGHSHDHPPKIDRHEDTPQ